MYTNKKGKSLYAEMNIPTNYTENQIGMMANIAYKKMQLALPYKTGNLSSRNGSLSFSMKIEDNKILLKIDGRSCRYAIYLENDIPKTQGYWELATSVFEAAFLCQLRLSNTLIQTAQKQYGYRTDYNKIVREGSQLWERNRK